MREEKEREVQELMEKLLNREAELVKVKRETREITDSKQKNIDEQQKRIRRLETSNSRLLTSVQQIKNDSLCRKNDIYNDIDYDTV